MRIAIVGAGVSGLVAAHLLHQLHEITLFEASNYLGGHANTVEVELDDQKLAIDTGFIVYNERNYPLFSRLLERLRVQSQPSDMSFSVSHPARGLEYKPTDIAGLLATASNAIRPSFYKMLAGIVAFNRSARQALMDQDQRLLGGFLEEERFSPHLRDDYIIPLACAIWSASRSDVLRMPLASYARFMENHGLLSFGDQPAWRSVTGGSARYVKSLSKPFADRVRLSSPVTRVTRRQDALEIKTLGGATEQFDAVVLATHADQSLRLLADPTPGEIECLGSISFQENTATLHTDSSVMPKSRRAWASWNYHVPDADVGTATLTYHMNRLQSLSSRHEILVTLNQGQRITPDKILASFAYEHPILDAKAVLGKQRLAHIQGFDRVWYCGAWLGYGFHEDGVRSAYEACRSLDPRALEGLDLGGHKSPRTDQEIGTALLPEQVGAVG